MALAICKVCGKVLSTKMLGAVEEHSEQHKNKTETEKEYEKLCKEIAKREDFLEKIDNQDTDLSHTIEQQKTEDEKIKRYEKELVELRKRFEETRNKLPKDSIYQPFSDIKVKK